MAASHRMLFQSKSTSDHIVPVEVRNGGEAHQFDAHSLDCWELSRPGLDEQIAIDLVSHKRIRLVAIE